RVERLADDDGVVYAVVVAEYGARASLRPGERRLFELAVEEALVEPLEHAREVVDRALRGRDQLAPALLTREVGGAQDFGREGVVAVDPLVQGGCAAASQEFRDEYEGERAVYVYGRALEHVRQAHVDA